MKRILLILLVLYVSANYVMSQNCPGNPTYKNQSGTFDLLTGRSVVVNSGGAFNITVENNFSSTSSICVLNGSTLYLSFQNANNIEKNGSIYVDKNSKLIFTGSNINNFPLTITNLGDVLQNTSVIYNDGAVINNSGIYTITKTSAFNSGAIMLNNSGTFTMSASSGFNSGAFTIKNTATGVISFNNDVSFSTVTLANNGTINCSGNMNLQNQSAITNNGYLYLQNGSGNKLTFNSGSITNNGVLYVSGETVINSGSTLTNKCTLKSFSSFTNNGTVNNTGSILLDINSSSATFLNQGTFTNGDAAFVQGYTFINNNSITGGGNFYFTATTTNQGLFKGTNGNKINFYDASQSNSTNIFDVQGEKPVSTNRNIITPNTATTFISCSSLTAPKITVQPQTQLLCSTAATSATFTVTATSNTAVTYQWRKNDTAISDATGSSYTVNNLSFTDTANVYTVAVTNSEGTTISSGASVHYIIIAQPSPVTQYLATGNVAAFTIQTSGATAFQWNKDGSSISNAITPVYTIPAVNLTDAGSYTAMITYSGGTCISDAAVLKTSTVLYSKDTGNLKETSTWGVETNGSGSTPVNFTREEHTFILSNRSSAETGGNLTIAGKVDVANSKVIITPGSTLNAGRIIRSSGTGNIAGSSTSSLTIHGISNTAYAGASDLYFDESNNILKNLNTAAHSVTLRNALTITAGKNPGAVQVISGILATSDSLTLKSDSLGTACITKSAGTINGKVTIEKYMPAKRSWRLIGAPVTEAGAPTIHTAWQEGAANSTDNPQPGFGTHITGGTEANGFDRSPTNNPSFKYMDASGNWVGLANTNATSVTQYPAYMFFVRGNRSYNILSTTNTTTPLPTVLRVKGNIYQGTQPAKTIAATGFTLVMNPYASPVSFAKITEASTNIKHRIRVWDFMLAGAKGVGEWVTLDGTGGAYKATPPSSLSTILHAGQGFLVESDDTTTTGSLIIDESEKDTIITPFITGRETAVTATDALLEVDLKVFNDDGSTGIADGVLYRFREDYNDTVDIYDARKMFNFNENLGIAEGKDVLSIDRRTPPVAGDSLRLNLTGTKTTNYQLEIVPAGLEGKTFFLFDKYMNTLTPISTSDTSRFTISINTSIADSKASDRFIIVVQGGAVLPVTFTKVKAYLKGKTVQVDWNVENETNIKYYEVEKSVNGTSFLKAATVTATGANSYGYTDVSPVSGTNFYRIKSVDMSGDVHYTDIVNVLVEESISAPVSIYPNPLTGNEFSVTFTGMDAGVYTLSLINQRGTVVFNKQITHAGGTASQKVRLTRSLPAGFYYLKTTAENGTSSLLKIVVN